ncbi:MAG TPA: exonuclease SbcCD subunit D [Chitinophagaceae bacterium]|nr:exonuclease SbcCD subunit D [Chitinophagaceae bacterium]
MRILHTADWHLGKKLDHFPRHEEQQQVLEEIVQIADDKNVDVVLIAGDLFDNFNPSNESLELYYQTLKALTNNGKRPVFAIAGNHDSPDKINTTDVLARSLGIFCFGYPQQELQKVTGNPFFEILKTTADFTEIKLAKYDFPFRIIHTPYANEQRLRQVFEFGEEDMALNEALKNHWSQITDEHCNDKGVNLLMTHLFMIGRTEDKADFDEPEGERPLSLGNATLINSSIVPKNIQYVALGHLHKYIRWENENTQFVYSGSPLSYSFSEAKQTKHVVLLDIFPNEKPKIEKIPLKKGKTIQRLVAQNVDDAIRLLEIHSEDLIELTIHTDEFLTQEELKTLRAHHAEIIRLIPQPKEVKERMIDDSKSMDEQDIESLFYTYFENKTGMKPNQEIIDLFKEIVHS